MEASTVLTLDWVPWVKLQKLHCHPFCVRINPFSPQTADPFLFVYRNNNYVLSAPQQLFLTKLYRTNYVSVVSCSTATVTQHGLSCHPIYAQMNMVSLFLNVHLPFLFIVTNMFFFKSFNLTSKHKLSPHIIDDKFQNTS